MSSEVDFGEYEGIGGAGFEGLGVSDLKIPSISVLQTNSPECDTRNGVKGAVAGHFYVKTTEEIIDGANGFNFVLLKSQHAVTEWRPRESGGGLVGVHEPGSEAFRFAIEQNRFGQKNIDPESGNVYVETFYLTILRLNDDLTLMSPLPYLLPLASTKIDTYKKFMTRILMFNQTHGGNIPRHAFAIKATTVPAQNAKGKFYALKFGTANEDVKTSLIGPKTDTFKLIHQQYTDTANQNDIKLLAQSDTTTNSSVTDAEEIPF